MGRAPNKRNASEGAIRLDNNYFREGCVYSDRTFRRRFRMRKPLFYKLEQALLEYNPKYWEQGYDATNKPGHSTKQKMTAALHMLCYGKSADSLDAELAMSETAILDALRHFTHDIVHIFREEYM
ncbi:hypothetical protein U9M48_000348 [Paspalum notatum var. saurae]